MANNSMSCAEFAALTDALGFKADALAELLDRKRSTISHYRTTTPPPPAVVRRVLALRKLLDDFKHIG